MIQNLLKSFDNEFDEENLEFFSIENFVSKSVYKVVESLRGIISLIK